MNSQFKNYLYVFISGCLWGTIGLFVKLMQNYGSSAVYTSFVRMVLGCVLLVVLTLVKDGPKAFKVSKNTLISCLLLGLVCQGIYNVMYSNAVNHIGMALASVLLYTAPVFTSITSVILFREKLGARKYLALVVNIIGCVLTVTGGNFGELSFGLKGLLFGVAAGFTYSLSAIFGRIATDDDSSPYAIAAYNFIFATIFLAIFRPWTTVENPWNPMILLVGLGFAIIPTALAYIFYFTGLKGITESSKVPVIASIETVLATIIGIVIFHEAFGVANLVGFVFVLASIAIMNLNFSKN